MRTAWKTWGEVFRHYTGRGHDYSDAAYRANQWEARRSIHPKAVHWTPSLARDGVGRVTGFQSEIGCTYRLPDGWHSECHSGPEFFGPFKSEAKARAAVTNFVNSGYVR